MEQLFSPENLDFVRTHSWTWYLLGAAFLQPFLICWAVVVIRRKSAQIKGLVIDNLTKADKNSSADVTIAKLQVDITTKELMIADLKQQLTNTKQLVMDGVEAYFDKKKGASDPPPEV
jgi:hypothetical protein